MNYNSLLSNDQVEDLIYWFCQAESECGVRSLYSSMVERASLYYHENAKLPPDYGGIIPKVSAPPSYSMDYLSLCWGRNIHDKTAGRIARGKRIRNHLLMMIENGASASVTMLYRVYGSPPPNVDWLLLPPQLAPIASFVDNWTEISSELQTIAINDPQRTEIVNRLTRECTDMLQCAERDYLIATDQVSV